MLRDFFFAMLKPYYNLFNANLMTFSTADFDGFYINITRQNRYFFSVLASNIYIKTCLLYALSLYLQTKASRIMAIKSIIGRNAEQKILEKVYTSSKSEFVAVCGRRRIGKTFLIKEFFEGKFSFTMAGLAQGGTKEQLANFNNSIERQYPDVGLKPASNWLDAFENLILCLSSVRKKRKIVFLDELPWMDTHKSNFVMALEHFWNAWAYMRNDIVLIVCGSSTSWMMDKLINNHGGLHNRLTKSVFLNPFSLYEAEKLLQKQGMDLSRYETAECYMIFGGIPYYLNMLDADKSLAQNVDSLLFDKQGELHHEFDNLYAALFKNSEDYIAVVTALAAKRGGMTRNELTKCTVLTSGGGLSKILNNLVSCGFVRAYHDMASGRKTIYQLVDFFTLFYFYFMIGKNSYSSGFWMGIQGTPKYNTWAGLGFELLALHHILPMKKRLGISGVMTEEFAWRKHAEEGKGAQVDLVLLRKDKTANLCEMKFSESSYNIDRKENENLRNRIASFRQDLNKPSYSIRLTMVTSFGLTKGKYNDIVADQVVLDDLFED